jgi:hypothetical protein
MKQFLETTKYILKQFVKNEYFSYFQYRKNWIDSVEMRNNTNNWTKTHKAVSHHSFRVWLKGYINYLSNRDEVDIDINNLDLGSLKGGK